LQKLAAGHETCPPAYVLDFVTPGLLTRQHTGNAGAIKMHSSF
jgi:hypothetical protein